MNNNNRNNKNRNNNIRNRRQQQQANNKNENIHIPRYIRNQPWYYKDNPKEQEEEDATKDSIDPPEKGKKAITYCIIDKEQRGSFRHR